METQESTEEELDQFYCHKHPNGSEYEIWFGHILQELAENRFDPFSRFNPNNKWDLSTTTKWDIIKRFEQTQDRDLQEAIEWYDENPSGYGAPDPRIQHPWNSQLVNRCRKFIKFGTVDFVWAFRKRIKDAALQALENNLTGIVFLDDENSSGKAATQERDLALKQLKDTLDALITEEAG